MDIFNFNPETVFSFWLTFFRVSLVVFLLPFFGGEAMPVPIKAALCIVLSLALWPHLSFDAQYFPEHPAQIAVMIMGELVLGLILGLIVHFLFAAIQTGGDLIAFQMGFKMMNVVDPLTGLQESITTQFLYMCSMLVFLSINGHLYMLMGLTQSFDLIPPGGLFITPELINQIIYYSSQIFVLAFKIASPIIATVFLVNLGLAFMARTAPQMNVLLLGFPIKIAVGLLFLSLVFQLISLYVSGFISDLGGTMYNLLRAAAGPS
ncbi:flagellar biosynthetic protein FliR [Desulfonatronospira thiodismutans ASO3-1]|uniref:Flagellar biosynthetic protein FliR n=1 Tax=Desulfonatronospira thiodismutans ASO3-1 TaxID=555779 RepID=D6SMP4_9BACT|nr:MULTISPECIES: flagellar biosynthetic protein FliR [Desulfonatronospira]EFI35955.1 flagellar biosynthetic protein FliR [Desulfonatronospira thiodismutans ASO3-1]RQD79305.1 MAG: flagellar biosynthetic protein FliR [Desulfonatronospira sp. MSAO_Bac3]